jgi:large subunit ribosomal protein L25
MDTVDIKATLRTGIGKQVTRKLRAAGQIPATLYGAGQEPRTLQIDEQSLIKIFRAHPGGNFILNLAIDDQKPELSIIRERQRHPVSGALVHLDFQRVRADKPIHVQVPIHLTGESPGVKDFGGVLEHVLRQVEISCLPMEIPDDIILDIGELMLNDSIHVSDLELPKLNFITAGERTIVAVSAPRVSTEAEEAAEGEEAEGEETEGEEGKDEAKSDADSDTPKS